MDKELIETFEAAKKAADAAASGGSADESRCLDALKVLRNFPVNYDMLVSSQVGKRLRHLTKHPSEKIQTSAAELVDIWKNIITVEVTRKKNGNLEKKDSVAESDDSTGKSIKVKKASRDDTIIKVEKHDIAPRSEKIAKTESFTMEKKVHNGVAVEAQSAMSAEVKVERVVKQEKLPSSIKRPSAAANAPPKLTSMIKCHDNSRDKVRELVHQSLLKVYDEADKSIQEEVNACDPIRVAVSVESTMFEKWGSSTGSQKQKYRSTMFNLKDSNNPDFRRRVLLGEIAAEQIADLTPEDMASDQRRAENQQIQKKALFECERGGPPKATTDQFRCGRCGQRKCTYYQLQTRSADEPMTTFVTCVNCNNHWKFC